MKSLLNPVLAAIILFLIAGVQSYGQKAEVEKRLKEYGIPEDFFVDNLKDENAFHSFKTKTTSISDTITNVEVASFDPNLPDGKRWELLSYNGKEPTKKQQKQFHKAHNESKEPENGEPNDEDWQIVEDNEKNLIIGFRYQEKNLPHKYKFLAECLGKVYIDKAGKQLEKVEFYSTAPLKIKIFNVQKLDMTEYYQFEEESGTYLVEKEESIMDVRLFGQNIEVKEIVEFYDYKKVR